MGILILNESGLKFLLFVFLFSQNINPARERKKRRKFLDIYRNTYIHVYLTTATALISSFFFQVFDFDRSSNLDIKEHVLSFVAVFVVFVVVFFFER